MANSSNGNSQQIDIKITGDASGFEKAVKQVEKTSKELTKNLTSVDKQVQKLTDHFNNLLTGWNGSIQLQQKAELPNYIRNGDVKKTSRINGVERSYITSRSSAIGLQEIQKMNDLETAEVKKNGNANRKLTRALAERTKAEANLTKEILKQKQTYASENQENKTRNSITNALNAQNRRNYLDMNKDWLAYRNEHPEQFVSKIYNGKYQVGSAISEVGSIISQNGVAGRVAGDLLQIGGAFVISRVLGFAVALTKVVSSVNDFAKAMTESYKAIEATKAQLSVVYNSRSMSDLAFQDISQYAVRSPFGIEQTAEMAILLKQSGVYSVDLLDTLKMIGDTAGGDMEKMKRIANNYAQIVSIGKASMLDMRQFSYAGVPIFEAVSKELGVTQQELRKLISDGKVTSEIIEKVFKNLTGANGVFENAVETGAKTLRARTTNLEDTKNLMLAEVGDFVYKIGEKTGGDSLAYGFLNISEQFYQGISKWANGQNIERDIKTLTQNRSKIAEYERLLELAKLNGNTIHAEYLENEIKELKKQITIEDERSMNLASYNYKYNDYDDLKRKAESTRFNLMKDKNGKTISIDDIVNADAVGLSQYREARGYKKVFSNDDIEFALGLLAGTISYAKKEKEYPYLVTANGAGIAENSNGFTLYLQRVLSGLKNSGASFEFDDDLNNKDTYKYLLDTFSSLDEEFIRDYKKAIQLSKTITDGERLAHYENVTMTGQERAFSDVNKGSDKSNSIVNVAAEIKMAWEKSSEQQKKAEDEEKSLWAKTIEVIREIDKNTDENGVVDQSKLSTEQLFNYVNKGAFIGTKLNAVNTENAQVMAENKPILYSQYTSAMQKVFKEIADAKNLSAYFVDSIRNPFNLLQKGVEKGFATDKDFYINFNKTFGEQTDAINEALKNPNLSDKDKEFYNKLLTILNLSTLKLTADTSIKDIDLNTVFEEKNKVDEFVPLWKRILSSATGVSTSAITGTEQTLNFYHENLSTRNIVGNVLTELLKDGMNSKEVRKLTAYRTEESTLKGDTSTTWQIDWEKTRGEMSKFVNQIGVSTKGIEAWVNGLQGEIETYQTLLGSGILASETDGVKQAKYISAKQMDKNWISKDEQGVNAFGEVLRNAEGEIVADIREGIAYDKEGNELKNQQLEISGKIYDELEKHIKTVEDELKVSEDTLAKNTILNQLATQSYQPTVLNSFLRGGYEVSNFALNNPDSVMKFMRPLEDSEKEHFKVNNELELYLLGLSGNVEALMLFRKLTEDASRKLKDFINSEDYKVLNNKVKETEHQQEIQNAVNIYNKIREEPSSWIGWNENDNNPEHKNGLAGFQHRLVDKDVLEGLGISGVSVSEMAELVGVDESLMRQQLAAESMKNSLKEAALAMEELSVTATKGLFLTPFETLGENLGELIAGTKTWVKSLDDAKTKLRAIAGQMVSSLGTTLTECGLNIASAAAMEHNWGIVAAGLGLAALGGVASGFGSWLQSDDNNDDDDDKVEKLKDLKEGLADLLEQARSDALYYEKNLRHKTALGTNSSYSYQKVNDAIIAPNGNVISTAPDDYLIATKTPQNFANNQTSVKINNIVNNNAGVQVRQEQRRNNDGSIDIITTLEESIGSYIASEKSDNAFMARELRMRGVSSIM